RRGGYCFEHVTLFAAVLERLGYGPVRHSARVVLVTPRDAAPRTHMFLTVTLPEGTFVLDPGFGAGAPDFPVPLVHSDAPSDISTTHWMERDADGWRLHLRTQGK